MLMSSFRLRCQRPEQRLLLRADHQARARRHHLQARSSSGRMGLLPGESDHWGHARAGAGQEGYGRSTQEVEEDGQEQDYGRAPERRGADGLSPGDWTGLRTGLTIECETCQYAEQCSLVRVAGLHGRLRRVRSLTCICTRPTLLSKEIIHVLYSSLVLDFFEQAWSERGRVYGARWAKHDDAPCQQTMMLQIQRP